MNRKIYFNPAFRVVNECTKRYALMKGSAGSGKSVDVAQDYVLKLSNPKYKGANLLCVRKIDESNRDSTFAELKTAIFRIFGSQWERYWNIRESPLRLECKTTGNAIIFRGMKDDKQREKVKSITSDKGKLTWIWVEEATELTEEDWDILDDRLRGRLDNPNLYYQMRGTFNPVSSTHWIKSKFFDNPDPNVLAHSSTFLDNLFVDEQYKMRMERRRERDPEGYRVYALGEWGLLGGQYFNNWSENLHVIKPFKIPEGWMRFRSMDWGSYHPYSVHWYAVDYDGVLYCYRELYGYGGKANVGTKEPSTAVAQRIADAERADKRLIQYGVLDNACWGKQDPGAPSIAEEINRVLMTNGCRMFNPSTKGREQVGEEIRLRLQGWEDAKGVRHPGIKIFNTCFHLIRTLPEITHDKNQPEKYDTNGEDHCLVAGTLITTSRGDIPIEQVTTDDYVLTRKGYKKVLKSWLTKKNAKVLTIAANNGKTLTGTYNHPVFVEGKGYIPLDEVSYGDIMYSIGGDASCQENNLKQQKASYLTALHLEDTQIQADYQSEDIIELMEGCGNKASVTCTDTFGNSITDQSQKDTTFITRTRTHLITALTTLNCCQARAIYNSMLMSIAKTKLIWKRSKKTLIDKGKKLGNGILQMLAESGIVKEESLMQYCKKQNQELKSNAKCVEQHSTPTNQWIGIQNSAQKNATQNSDETLELMMLPRYVQSAAENIELTSIGQKRLVARTVVLSCLAEQEHADVYNLTVDEVHEYFANGFLVHNCVDDLGYACMSRPWKPEKPKQRSVRDGWKDDYNNEAQGRVSFMGV